MRERRRAAGGIVLLLALGLGACASRRPALAPVAPTPDLFGMRPDGWMCIGSSDALPMSPAVAFTRARAALATLAGAVAADSATGRLLVAGPDAPAGARPGIGTPGQRAARLYFSVAFDPATTDAPSADGRTTAWAQSVGATGTAALPPREAAVVYDAAERFGVRFWQAMGHPSLACQRAAQTPPSLRRVPASTRTPAAREAPHIRRAPGELLEVIGLRRWTLAMLEDSLAKHAPGTSLATSGCAAVLRYRLGFADAAVVEYAGFPDDSARHVVVMLVEPGDSARVRHQHVALDTVGGDTPWRDAVARFTGSEAAFMTAVTAYPRWRRTPAAPQVALAAADPMVAGVLRFLAAHATDADARLARQLLASSPDYRTRAVAAAVLGNTLADDATVHALTRALLQRDGPAKTVAATVLRTLTTMPARRQVQWEPAAPAVHALLDSTSPLHASQVLPVLIATGVGPSDARALLRGGGTMVLDFLAADQPGLRAQARAILVALRGADLGPAPEAWRRWIATL